MNAAQLQAQHDEDYEDSFEEARYGFNYPPYLWPKMTNQLHAELSDFYLLKMANANWDDEAEIGRLLKAHIREAFERVWGEIERD